tara:strand:- start:374 stop:610 length:237 start_codon:yes stop_codon:yes gene_type:complete
MYVEKQRTKDLRKRVKIMSVIFTVACISALIAILTIMGTGSVAKILMLAIAIVWIVGIWRSSKIMGETIVRIENSRDH